MKPTYAVSRKKVIEGSSRHREQPKVNRVVISRQRNLGASESQAPQIRTRKMSRYYFDINDGHDFTRDDDGMVCDTLEQLGYQAVDVLPDIVREELPDGPRRTFSVKVRNDRGRYVFRASLTLASAWIVETIGGEKQPGGDRWDAALQRAKTQITALRKEFAEDGYSQHLEGLDSLLSVAEAEVDRLLTRGGPKAGVANQLDSASI